MILDSGQKLINYHAIAQNLAINSLYSTNDYPVLFVFNILMTINLILLTCNCCLLTTEAPLCHFKDDALAFGKMSVKYLLLKKS